MARVCGAALRWPVREGPRQRARTQRPCAVRGGARLCWITPGSAVQGAVETRAEGEQGPGHRGWLGFSPRREDAIGGL